jgi:hypothetical protein
MLVLSWQYQPDKRPQRYRQLSDLAPGDVLDLARKSRRSWREVPAAQERSGGEKAGGCSGAGERISKERGEPCAVLGGGGGVGDGDKAGDNSRAGGVAQVGHSGFHPRQRFAAAAVWRGYGWLSTSAGH